VLHAARGRLVAARASLQQAARARPPFATLYRVRAALTSRPIR